MSRGKSLRTRFIIALTCCVVVLYGGTSWLVQSLVLRSGRQHLDQRLQKRLAGFITDIDWKEGDLDLDFHLKSPPEFKESSRIAFYELRDHQYKVIVRSFSLGLEEDLPVFDEAAFKSGASIFTLNAGTEVRVLGTAFRPPIDEDTDSVQPKSPPLDSPENVFYLTVAESMGDVQQHQHDVTAALLFGGIFLVGACIAIAGRAARWLHQPVVRLAERAAAIDERTLDQPIAEAGTPEEMRPIILQLNALLVRLNNAMQRERRFSAALAHELRTPVAELLALAEVALLESDADSALRENPREVYTETARLGTHLSKLIDVLQVIHSGSDAHEHARCEAFDLRSIADRAANSFRSQVEAAGRRLELHRSDTPVFVHSDPDLVEAIVTGLLRNAADHSDAACTIALTVNATPPGLSIRNAAGDLCAADLPHLIEPLWQKDPARTHPGRFGIGLTLCKAYADIIGARISFDHARDEFTASLQLSDVEQIH